MCRAILIFTAVTLCSGQMCTPSGTGARDGDSGGGNPDGGSSGNNIVPLAVTVGPDDLVAVAGIDNILMPTVSVSGGTPPYTFSWIAVEYPGPGLTILNPESIYPTFEFSRIAPVGSYLISVTVRDASGTVASDNLTILVGGQMANLTANAGPDKSADVGEAVSLTGTATGGIPPYTFDWELAAAGTSGTAVISCANCSTCIVTFSDDASGNFTFSLRATDGQQHAATDSTTVTVTGTSATPVTISILSITDPVTGDDWCSYTYSWTPEDQNLDMSKEVITPDGRTYLLGSGGTGIGGTYTLGFKPSGYGYIFDRAGTYTWKLTVTYNGQTASATKEFWYSPSSNDGEASWTRMTIDLPSSVSLRLRRVWGSGPNDVFAAGNSGGPTILHYGGEGSIWIKQYSDNMGGEVTGLWGSDAYDVYVVTRELYPVHDGILHYEGEGSSWEHPSVTVAPSDMSVVGFSGIWGSASDEILLLGLYGYVYKYDGSRLSKSAELGPGDYAAIWGSASDDVFCVGVGGGANGLVAHYDGSRWTKSYIPDAPALHSVSGSSWYSVFAVGNGGFIAHYDGSTWEAMDSPTTAPLTSVWCDPFTDEAFATGYTTDGGGVILHYDGSTWLVMQERLGEVGGRVAGAGLAGIWGTASDDVYAVGWDANYEPLILHYSGESN